MSDRLAELVAEARASAATVEHPWDRAALDWPDLPEGATVVEVGGYKGRWAMQMAERYAPRLFVFEPQPWAAAVCRAALGKRATVLAYGLGDRDDVLSMAAWETDGCSFVKASDGAHVAPVHEIGGAFQELEIETVDLLLMNIEGYEYTLLPHMLDRGILPQRLMVQWHGDTAQTARAIAQLEQAGYRSLWDYGAVLGAWECI